MGNSFRKFLQDVPSESSFEKFFQEARPVSSSRCFSMNSSRKFFPDVSSEDPSKVLLEKSFECSSWELLEKVPRKMPSEIFSGSAYGSSSRYF